MNNQEMMELTTVDKSEFEQLVKECRRSGSIDQNLYIDYDVKRGLRDSNGNGVLTGLTEISDVCGNENVNGRKIPVDGQLYFQGSVFCCAGVRMRSWHNMPWLDMTSR